MSDSHEAVAARITGEKLDDHEAQIIAEVCRRYESGEPLAPDYAIQKWIAIAEGRRIRRRMAHAANKAQSEAVRHAVPTLDSLTQA